MSKEARARIKINELLKEAGWRLFNDAKGRANIVLEDNVEITEHYVNGLGKNFRKSRDGFIEFLILGDKVYPFPVWDSESEQKIALTGKKQAKHCNGPQKLDTILRDRMEGWGEVCCDEDQCALRPTVPYV